MQSILFLIFGICFLLLSFYSFNLIFLSTASASTMPSAMRESPREKTYFVTSSESNANRDEQQVVPKPERCGNGQDSNVNGFSENCSGDSSSVGIPAVDFNRSKTLRIAIVGDVDSNQGLTTQLEITNRYNVQALILTGDFEYSNGNNVLSELQSHGFTKENTDIVVGNHDSEQDVKAWLNEKEPFGQVNFAFDTDKLALFNIDANTRFDCSSPQFEVLKSLEITY